MNATRSLLKRIGSILTAPPKITDKDYLEMKKRCVSTGRGLKAQYEQRIVEKKNRDFFEHLKTVKPYYKVKLWEDDYKKQVYNIHSFIYLLFDEICVAV